MCNPNITQTSLVGDFETGLEQHNMASNSEDFELYDPNTGKLELEDWLEEEWILFSQNGLNNLSGAYGDDEPDYSDCIAAQ